MSLTFAPEGTAALPLVAVDADALEAWRSRDGAPAAWLDATGFGAEAGAVQPFPSPDGGLGGALLGLGDAGAHARDRFVLAKSRDALPAGVWRLEPGGLEGAALEAFALGWLLAGYRFDRYKAAPVPKAALVAPEGVDAARLEAIAASEALTRDLINAPASDMGPAALEAAIHDLGAAFGAEVSSVEGAALLDQNLPLIHAVGRAAAEAPRLVTLRWGTGDRHLALVGKGVCFDTGGLNLKTGASMGLMKKDMGGAATVLGLARAIMALDLPLRLTVLVPAVENAVAGGAFRPGDVLTSRSGRTVEINNTDAEGRLVLADALTSVSEEAPDLTISMATLTGAARVALGPDIAPFYATEDADAAALSTAADTARDPVWRLPFWEPYESMIEPGIADLDNAPKGGFAGSITAALFLRRFAPERYLHFDIYAWQPQAAPARPKGGVGQGARALLAALPALLRL